MAAEELEYRFQWTFPLAMSPHDRTTIYAGSQVVHRTTNGGRIEVQTKRLLQIRDDMNSVVEMIHRIEWTRKQLYDLKEVHKEDEAIVKAVDDLDEKLLTVEEELTETRLTGRGQDALRWPSRLVSKLTHLATGISTADFSPTTQQVAVHEMFQKQIRELRQKVEELLSTELTAFTSLLKEKGIANVTPKI